MKELSIEQKARRYDSAIERAKRAHNSAKSDKENGVTDKITEYTIQLLETIFPELAKPKDEKIMKALLEMVHDTTGDELWVDYNIHKEEALAWLEKQLKVKEAMRDVEQKAKAFTKANKGLTSDEILAQMRGEWWSEKQGEQKPIECRQENKPNGGIVCEDFNDGDGYYKVNLAYLSKSQVELIENLVASWQNQTNNTAKWSEEDENGLGDALWAIQKARTIAKDENDMGNLWYAEHWLKSLKDRYTWKPSDEIMKGLNEIINKLAISPVIHEHGYLYDLMVNLRKKLK